MRKQAVWTGILAMVLVLATMVAAVPAASDNGLRSGFAKIRDWDKAHEAFSFESSGVVTTGGDFFIAPRGIHAFESPGIIDMGLVYLDDIAEAPATGYLEMVTPVDGHTYVVRSKGKYGKFYLEETYDWLNPVEYGISWKYQPNGTRSFIGAESGCTYDQYIAAYNKLTTLMSQGKGDTPEGKIAYEEYAKVKACYESGSSGTGSPATTGQTGTGAESGCTYQDYITAYNKLNYLNTHGQANTPESKLAYEQYARIKACYESGSSGTGQPSVTSTTTAAVSSGQTFRYRNQDYTPNQNGQGAASIGQDDICISSMNPGGAWVQANRTYSITSDYTVDLDFKITEKDNHFIVIYSDGYLFLDVDWGTALSHHQPGAQYNLRQVPFNLQPNQWYKIRMDAHPALQTFDVYIDGSKVSTATGINAQAAQAFHNNPSFVVNCTDCIYFGDPDSINYSGGKYNRGSACWRNISVTGQPAGASTGTTPAPAATTAVTGQQQLYPVADGEVYAYSYRNWNWANCGALDRLGAGWDPTGGEKRAYLRFDVPANISVSQAVLKLYQSHSWGPVHDLGVYRVTGPWDEGTGTYHSGQVEKTAAPGELCWMQQPSFDQVPVAVFRTAAVGENGASPTWVQVDITALVQQWQSGTSNYGVVIKTTNVNPTSKDPVAKCQFRTRESADPQYRPVLEISTGGTATTSPSATPPPSGASSSPPSTSSSSPSTNPLVKTISKLCPLSAAYGSPEAPELYVFRQFRDRVLAKHPAGIVAINTYYYCSPFLVDMMTYCEVLQPVVRYCLAEPAAAILNNTSTIWNN